MYPPLTSFPGDLFADFDRFQRQLDQAFGWPSSIRAVARGSFPAINMGTTQDAVEIYAFAPGLEPSKIELAIDKGLLSITGEREVTTPDSSDNVNVYARERFAGAFKRVVSLPDDVDASKVEAKYRNGVLSIVIPKLESRMPRRVEVKQVN
jgi:HSP20 family protein